MRSTFNSLSINFQQHWNGSRAQAFVKWWLAELTSALPERWQPNRNIKSVRWPLPEDPPSGADAVQLHLDPDQVLHQTIVIPRPALRNADEMLRYELDKFSPLDSSKIHYAWRVMSTHEQQAIVSLFIIRRGQLQEILDACHARGMKVVAIDVLDSTARAQGVDLLPRQYRQTSGTSDQEKIINTALLTACAVLIAAAMVLWLHARSEQLASAQSQVDALHARVRQLDRAFQKAKAREDARAWSLHQKNSHPPLSIKLAQVTQCLPQDSWLTHLEVDQANSMSISGFSANPEQLLNQMQHCRGVAEPQFRGVIQADKTTGKSRFTLALQLTGTMP